MLEKSSSTSLSTSGRVDEPHAEESFLAIMEKKRKIKYSENEEGGVYSINSEIQKLLLAHVMSPIKNAATRVDKNELVGRLLMSNHLRTVPQQKNIMTCEEVRQNSPETDNHSNCYEVHHQLDKKENNENSIASYNQGHISLSPGEATTLVREEKSQTGIVRHGFSYLQLRVKHEKISDSIGNQSIKFDYQFRSWSGSHSVQVHVNAGYNRDVNITLLPSDAHVAGALSKNIEHTMRSIPYLSSPPTNEDTLYQHPKDEEEKE